MFWELGFAFRGPNRTFVTCHLSYVINEINDKSHIMIVTYDVYVKQIMCQCVCQNLRMDFYNPPKAPNKLKC